MFGGLDIQKMMKQAQKIQQDMGQVQEELGKIIITGTAGGGAVTVTCNGKLEFTQVKISPEAAGDPAMLEDLVLAAIQDATKKVNDITQEKMSSITNGLNIPGFKLPF